MTSEPNYQEIAKNGAKVQASFSDILVDRNKEIEDLKEYVEFLEYFGKMTIDIADCGDEAFRDRFNYGDVVDSMKAFDVGRFL